MEQDDPVQWLIDHAGNKIGQVTIEKQEGDTVTGRFTPGPDYPLVEPLFRSFAEAAEAQALSRVDRLGAEIGRLGLRLHQCSSSTSLPIHDVQLWDNEIITYRLVEVPASVEILCNADNEDHLTPNPIGSPRHGHR